MSAEVHKSRLSFTFNGIMPESSTRISSKLPVSGHLNPPVRKRDRSAIADDTMEMVTMPSEERVVAKHATADRVQGAGTAVSVKQPDSAENAMISSKKAGKKQQAASPTVAKKSKVAKDASQPEKCVNADDKKEQLTDYDACVHPDVGDSPADR